MDNVVGHAIAGVGLAISAYYGTSKLRRTKRRDANEETKAEVDEAMAKAKELADLREGLIVLSTDIGWIKEQLGKSPNGGGIMEQMQKFIETANKEFASIRQDQIKHLELHLEATK